MPLASVLNRLLPFAAFGAFSALFMIQARRRGQSPGDYLAQRNRETFSTVKPGLWKVHVAWALFCWILVFVESSFKLLLLAFLPLVLLSLPFFRVVFYLVYRRR